MTESELSQYCREKVCFLSKSKAGAANVCKGSCRVKSGKLKQRSRPKLISLKSKRLRRSYTTKKRHSLKLLSCWFYKKAQSLLRERTRRRLTSTDERQHLIALIHDAKQSGCRLEWVCYEVQIDVRTYRRWYRQGEVQADERPTRAC